MLILDTDSEPESDTILEQSSEKSNQIKSKNNSKPNSNKTELKASNLFQASDDDADLFSTKISTKKSTKISTKKSTEKSRKSSTKSVKKVSLFGDDVENDDLFSTKSTSVKSKKTKGLFSDDDEDQQSTLNQQKSTKQQTNNLISNQDDVGDLFSTKSNPTNSTKPINKLQSDEDDFMKPPSIKSSSSSRGSSQKMQSKVKMGLFDDSSDDDGLFTATPKPKLTQQPILEKPKPNKKNIKTGVDKKKSSLFDDDDDDLFDEISDKSSITKHERDVGLQEDEPLQDEDPVQDEPLQDDPPKKKLAGAVSMFGAGGGELLAAIGKRRAASHVSTSSNSSLKSDPLESSSAPTIDKEDVKPTTNISAKPFNFTPSNTKPVTTKVHPPTVKSSKTQPSSLPTLNIDPTALLPGAAPKPRPPPDTSKPLESATKTRSRGQAGRRPPSRQARRKVATQVDTADDFFDASTTTTSSGIDQQAKPTTSKPKPNDKVDDFLDDLLGNPVTPKSSVIKKKESKNLFDDDEDFFKPTSGTSKIKVKDVDLFADDDDLFGSTKDQPPTSTSDKKKKKIPKQDLDDLFGDDLDPVLPKKKVESKQTTVTHEDNLFDDNTDIFADLPKPKKKVPKTKKSKAPTTSLFDDDLDDIFAKPTKSSSKKVSKKSTKQSEKNGSKDGDLFDDPLNALLS
ncbi:uncharacterized protein LOC144742457 [Ciona intestinalis]